MISGICLKIIPVRGVTNNGREEIILSITVEIE